MGFDTMAMDVRNGMSPWGNSDPRFHLYMGYDMKRYDYVSVILSSLCLNLSPYRCFLQCRKLDAIIWLTIHHSLWPPEIMYSIRCFGTLMRKILSCESPLFKIIFSSFPLWPKANPPPWWAVQDILPPLKTSSPSRRKSWTLSYHSWYFICIILLFY